MKNSKKYFAATLVILAIIMSLGAYLYLQKSAQVEESHKQKNTEITPISTWKKYTDEKEGYSFLYPNDWVPNKYFLETNMGFSTKENLKLSEAAHEWGGKYVDFSITVCENINTKCALGVSTTTKYKNLATQIETQRNKSHRMFSDDNYGFKTITKPDISLQINGVTGYGLDVGGAYGTFEVIVENPKNGKIYLLGIPNAYEYCGYDYECKNNPPRLSPEQKAIIESFKF